MWLACSIGSCIQEAIRHLSSLQSVETCAFWWGLSLPNDSPWARGNRKKERWIVPSTHDHDQLAGKTEYALVPQIQYNLSVAGQWPSVVKSSHWVFKSGKLARG